MAKGAKKFIKKQMVWEGKFKNIFKNMHFLHGGAASASRDAAPFYKQIELDNTLDLLMEERESRKNIREHALDLESQIERLKIYKGADHDSPGC